MDHAEPIGFDHLRSMPFNFSPALGAAEPQYRIRLFGEHCLSGASCAAI
ncbi:hypothetical protein [Candidatus Nitronereus thalassa]|uniref:Uncharacterized protein n=1 Tax=Candidatus Nitronereus thalassa TaxID=3020898 RepID=A0ABU3K9D9_9BACT|nr:hypothetical protein [Candidatus Nitronereus thalassa]MDT7043064.1 hypothetical protein [Candidatus Nitronereus thalassa]